MGYSRTGSIAKDHKHLFFNVLLVSICLSISIVIVYIKVQNFDFVGFDDELYVTENHIVQKGVSLEGIKWAFTTFHSANWHPLTWVSHMLDYELYGLNAGGHHWTNVQFHIANTLLLFFIFLKMTGATWRSAFAAALFALHPLHVESVAWVSERKDVLSAFFGLLSIFTYYHYVKKSSVKYYILVFLLMSASLLAKPMLVTLPFLLLLLDFWPLKRFQHQLDIPLNTEKAYGDAFGRNCWIILEKIPFFIPVVISCIVTFIAQKSEGAVKSLEVLKLKYRIANAIVSYVSYALKAVWPHKLAVFYPHPGNTLPSWQIVGATLLIVVAFYWAIKAAKKYPYIPVGLFWYLGTLVPVIGLVQVGEQAMADRYTYIPLIGLFVIASWGVSDFFKERRWKKIIFGIAVGILLAALSWKSFFQLNTWKNGITLFEYAVSVTEKNYSAYNNLGKAYEPIDLDKAVSNYKKALKIKPDDEMVFYNLGNAFLEKGDIDEAVRHYLKALNIKPNYPAALNNLGEAFVKKNDYDNAVYYFKRALNTDTKKVNLRMNFANVLFLQKKPDEAISKYQKILQADSENANAHYNLACMLSAQKKIDQAEHHYMETLRINPNHDKAHYNLGDIYLNQGKTTEAFMHYAELIKIEPDNVQAYNKLGLILLRQRKYDKAKVFFSKAKEIDPDYSEARTNLDIVQNTK